MKAVILAGGRGIRIAEETDVRPKPMVEIGGHPILWHIMKLYSHYGITEFVVCLGYKGNVIRDYFVNYDYHHSDLVVDLKNGTIMGVRCEEEPWTVTLVDTGEKTMTGGRLKAVARYLDGPFMLTYGDGVADISLSKLMAFHRNRIPKALCTVTAVQPKGRFGRLQIDDRNRVAEFSEKPQGDEGWINAGFFVCEPRVMDYIDDDPQTVFERGPLERLASDGELYAYHHEGFWKCLDTMGDKNELEQLWQTGPQWKVW